MAALDATVVGIALPAIGRDFGVGRGRLQWVVNAYTLTLAGLLLLGGALGDRYGRRRVFVIGVVWFAARLAAVRPRAHAGSLIAGAGAAGRRRRAADPGQPRHPAGVVRPDDRSQAIGAWSGLGGVATAVGPFLGGWLISAVSWRLVFLINLPLAVAGRAAGLRHVPESRDPDADRAARRRRRAC